MKSAELKFTDPQLQTSFEGDPRQHAAHESLAHASKGELERSMPDLHIVETANGHRIQYAELASPEAQGDKARILLLPFGNGYALHTYIRALQIHKSFDDDSRTIIFPNATPGNKPYTLSAEEQAKVATGNLDVVAEKFLRASEALGAKTLELIGFSQGASVGGAAIKRAAENGSVGITVAHLGEPANVLDRTPKQLQKAFQKTGLGALIKAVNDAGIPALSEYQHTRGGIDTARLLGGLVGVLQGSKIPENKAMHQAMSHNTFVGDVSEALMLDPNLKIVLLGAELSTIYPKSVSQQISAELERMFPGRVESIEIEGRNHAAADNTTEYAAATVLGHNKVA
jgi:hypothetical protein